MSINIVLWLPLFCILLAVQTGGGEGAGLPGERSAAARARGHGASGKRKQPPPRRPAHG